MKKIVYISGKVRGVLNFEELFAEAQKKLEAKGYIVFNPATMPKGIENNAIYMNVGIEMLKNSDYIYMLDNWKESPGAQAERNFAMTCGIPILHPKF